MDREHCPKCGSFTYTSDPRIINNQTTKEELRTCWNPDCNYQGLQTDISGALTMDKIRKERAATTHRCLCFDKYLSAGKTPSDEICKICLTRMNVRLRRTTAKQNLYEFRCPNCHKERIMSSKEVSGDGK